MFNQDLAEMALEILDIYKGLLRKYGELELIVNNTL